MMVPCAGIELGVASVYVPYPSAVFEAGSLFACICHLSTCCTLAYGHVVGEEAMAQV